MRFDDRRHAGRLLAERVASLLGVDGAGGDASAVLVLGLPRGGVPVAAAVARRLGAPLDVFVVRKLGVPGHEELAMGALASGGTIHLDHRVVRGLGVSDDDVQATVARETAELARREDAYRRGRAPTDLAGRTVVLVDDGLATGSTMRVAVTAVRERGPARVVVAVPVGAPESCADLAVLADELVCALAPERFAAVGQFYDDFTQTTDDEVRALLDAQ